MVVNGAKRLSPSVLQGYLECDDIYGSIAQPWGHSESLSASWELFMFLDLTLQAAPFHRLEGPEKNDQDDPLSKQYLKSEQRTQKDAI